MASRVGRGEIWLLDRPRPDKRRPVLVLSRPVLIHMLHTVTVAPITSTVRGAPTEVVLGVEHGLRHRSAANLANVLTIRQTELRHFVGSVDVETMRDVCGALAIAVGCD